MSCQVSLGTQTGWRHVSVSGADIWFKGYLIENGRILTGADGARRLASLPAEIGKLSQSLEEFDGLFSVIVKRGDVVLAAVDRIASIPLLVLERSGSLLFFDGAASLDASGLELAAADDTDACLALAMSGYTIGTRSIYRDVSRLIAGECLTLDGRGRTERRRYYEYRAWEAAPSSYNGPDKALTEILTTLIDQLITGVDGRTIVVPLSAGLDSRLIVSGLREAGYDAVKCFSYGRSDNFEARAAKAIAGRLGYEWTFVPYTLETQRDAFASAEHAAYHRFADSLTAVPFEQDFLAIQTLVNNGWMRPGEDVIVNGQSGDYNTGNHIPPSLGEVSRIAELTGAKQGWDPVLNALIDKHYSLWDGLKSRDNIDRVSAQLAASLREAGAPEQPGAFSYALFEYLEFDNRQSKYTVGGQRVYEYFGFDWRLPLWETPFVEFWRTMALEHKFEQRLYRETLIQMDWGAVWSGIEDKEYISPSWVTPVRFAARIAAAPIGRRSWHEVERRFFAYWMDLMCNYAHLPYRRVASDSRGFRNAISWFTEGYLCGHGLDWTGAKDNALNINEESR